MDDEEKDEVDVDELAQNNMEHLSDIVHSDKDDNEIEHEMPKKSSPEKPAA